MIAKRTLALLFLIFLTFTVPAFSESGDGLEGTSWKIRPKGAFHWLAWWNRDYLVFQQGNFIEAGLAKHGFKPSLYEAKKTANGIEWSAALQNSEHEQLAWKATRISYWMEGTYTRTEPDGTVTTVRWKAWQIFPPPPKP